MMITSKLQCHHNFLKTLFHIYVILTHMSITPKKCYKTYRNKKVRRKKINIMTETPFVPIFLCIRFKFKMILVIFYKIQFKIF